MRILARAITPKRMDSLDPEIYYDEIQRTIKYQTAPTVKRLYELGVRTWDHKPVFSVKPIISKSLIEVDVIPTGQHAEQYGYVHDGVPARIIVPRKPGGLLRFRSGYSPATRPGSITAGRARRSGDWASAKAVRWPGIKAREFSKPIAARTKPRFKRDIENALRRVARRST